MTPFESGVEIVLFIEAIGCFGAALVTRRLWLLPVACGLVLTMMLVRVTLHLSVEWVP